MFILGVDVGIKEVNILCQFSMVKGLCTVNVAWEEQANGPEGAYCRVLLLLTLLILSFPTLSVVYVVSVWR